MTGQDIPPKLFISYSWTSEEHIAWVIDEASQLRASGIDVILDKWDLREGHDAIAFMERIVTDQTVKKVALVCDKNYAEKADRRSGGVGAEAQILTPELYAQKEQSKFVAIIAENDEDGKPYTPAYFQSRIYIDLTDQIKFAENFERLVRWVFDKPLLVKPEIGKPPSYLVSENSDLSIGTMPYFRRAVDALRNERSYALSSLKEYLTALNTGLENFRIKGDVEPTKVIKNIEGFIPFRNQYIEVLVTLAGTRPDETYSEALHRFLEGLVQYLHKPKNTNQWQSWDFDNFRFIIHELFLYTIAIYIKHENFGVPATLIRDEYYNPERADYGQNIMVDYTIFNQPLEAIEAYNRAQPQRKITLQGTMLKERCVGTGVDFLELMTADFVLYLNCFTRLERRAYWFPCTLVYAGTHTVRAFPIFARAKSSRYFDRLIPLLGTAAKSDLASTLENIEGAQQSLPRFDYRSISPRHLLGFDAMCTRP